MAHDLTVPTILTWGLTQLFIGHHGPDATDRSCCRQTKTNIVPGFDNSKADFVVAEPGMMLQSMGADLAARRDGRVV